ncbi:hypothetical protein [Leifsonia virtsii]|uniref:Primosomal protein n=1 Tax=Leifsonia virtsii TaxID=3035915 RepID=A0ABT8IZD6_9MICO|nr:hypothetical protein [Leifsonia virtsii]MDN4598181.1 hypothetical protein [Leifsonia virtsii]
MSETPADDNTRNDRSGRGSQSNRPERGDGRRPSSGSSAGRSRAAGASRDRSSGAGGASWRGGRPSGSGDGENRRGGGSSSDRGYRGRDQQGASRGRDGQRDGGYRGRDGKSGGYDRREGQGGGYRGNDDQRDGGYRSRDGQRDGGYRGRPGQGGGASRGRDGVGYRSRDGQEAGGYRGRDGQSGGYRGRDEQRGGYRGRDGQGAAPRRDGEGRPQRAGGARDGRPPQVDRKPWSAGSRAGGPRRDDKLWTREGRPARGDRDARDQNNRSDEEYRLSRELQSVRPRHDDPVIPDDVQARDLPNEARVELKTLSKDNSDWVAKHLVMAGRLIESDPAAAHSHALSAARRAGRVAVVRETLAITAYATGDFALALRELRTYRRISGSNDQLPLMVDSERGVGRPDRALELGRSVDRATLPADVQVSLAIAMSGARLDLGQPEAALAELEIPQLDPDRAFSYSADLFHAYAEVLEELGRDTDAERWRERATRAEEALVEAGLMDEHETVDIVEEELDLDGTVDETVEEGADASTPDEEDEPNDGTVPTEH